MVASDGAVSVENESCKTLGVAGTPVLFEFAFEMNSLCPLVSLIASREACDAY